MTQKNKTVVVLARIKRVCSCGVVHNIIPSIARYQGEDDAFSGWYWECDCGTTLFIPERSLQNYIEAAV